MERQYATTDNQVVSLKITAQNLVTKSSTQVNQLQFNADRG